MAVRLLTATGAHFLGTKTKLEVFRRGLRMGADVVEDEVREDHGVGWYFKDLAFHSKLNRKLLEGSSRGLIRSDISVKMITSQP